MSNIRGLGDFNDGRDSRLRQQQIPLVGNGLSSSGDPRKESFFNFLKNFCCPLSTMKSVIFVITMLDIIVYIVTLCFGIGKSTPQTPYLLPPLQETLVEWSLYPKKLRELELWRWITYAFLHADFVHLLSNVVSQIIIGSFIERITGHWKVSLLYFVTTILGALFAVLIDNKPSVGASITIYGLLGAYIGFSFINWNYLDTIYGPTNKYLNLFFVLFIVLLNFSSQISNPLINNWGHLGGLLVGFFFIFVIMKPIREGDGICCPYKLWLSISAVLLGAFAATGFSLFYILDHYIN